MTQQSEHRRSLKTILRDERGVALVLVTIFLPVIVGLFTFATDMAYVLWTRNTLQVTAETAALAATAQLPDNGACATTGTACNIAKKYAEMNMPAARYGTVLANNDVVLGRWTDHCLPGGASDATCFAPLPAGTSCVTFQCNGVQVTTRQAAVNGNALSLVFAPMIGITSFDVSATAIAVYGLGENGAQPTWDVIIVQDISPSFLEEMPQGKAADKALLECMKNFAAPGSKLGLTLFSGCSGFSCSPPLPTYQQPAIVTSDPGYTTLSDKIGDPANTNSGVMTCGHTNAAGTVMPPCTNTNPSAGMSSAYTQFCPTQNCPVSIPGSRRAMVLVSDGEPVGHSSVKCGGDQHQCSTSELKAMAVAQADRAALKDIDVYTIFYGPNGSAADWMETLKRGNGLALKTPDPAKLTELMAKICAQMPHRLVW